jgi:hypothetical protein
MHKKLKVKNEGKSTIEVCKSPEVGENDVELGGG